MSDVSVDIIKNRSGEAPDLPSGANLSGVSTAATLQVTNLNPTHINASGVTTATTFSGSLKSTGKPTLGLGVTINSSGINISGVATAGIVSATTLYGDGSNLTGVAMSIAPISYQPSVSAVDQDIAVSIGITFTDLIKAGSGNVTLRLVGAAGTVVENFGVGNSVTINQNRISFTPTASLEADTVYHLSYPSGAFTNLGGDVSYVGTAYTFDTRSLQPGMFIWGYNGYGGLGQNDNVSYGSVSSPIQIPGATWSVLGKSTTTGGTNAKAAIKTDGTLWVWGSDAEAGELGLNDRTRISSPTQVPGTTWNEVFTSDNGAMASKTNGTLWGWGNNGNGELGVNDNTPRSSPTQIPGTTWTTKFAAGAQVRYAIKSDNTLWSWGSNAYGQGGWSGSPAATPDNGKYSSPVQIPGTNWASISASGSADGSRFFAMATKSDNTLWAWGGNGKGELGQNEAANNDKKARSSPTQIPGTDWATGMDKIYCGQAMAYAIKTNGELWAWGQNPNGHLGQNNQTQYSSPVQVPGTTWSKTIGRVCLKTDNTLWAWGQNQYGVVGNNTGGTYYSSPVQIPGTEWTDLGGTGEGAGVPLAIKNV